MGKVIPSKPNSTLVHKSKPVRNGGLGKSVPKVSLKRLIMLQRRINALVNEKISWEDKNRSLLDNLSAEKMRCASFRKESFHWQRLYHESMVTVNTYKVKQTELTQVLTACLREIDSIYPNMVALSECVTTNKIRISNLLASLPAEYDSLPRQFQDTGKGNDTTQRNGKPTRHRVGPMVKGMLITKPKILLERVMLPQPQEQGNSDMSTAEVNNPLTPIAEENELEEENVRMAHISMRPKRRLGSAWRIRMQEKLEKDRERDRVNKPTSSMVYDEDSSDTDNTPAQNHMEPVVRFKDVSRLLQNSALMKVDSARTEAVESSESTSSGQSKADTHHKGVNSKNRTEDPLEGSSWMFPNNLPIYIPQRKSSLYRSESSDDDDDDENAIMPQNNISNSSSTMNTLVNRNQTFLVPESDSKERNSLSAEYSPDIPTTSPVAEPDSTNYIDSELLNNTSSENYSRTVFKSSSSTSGSISNYIQTRNTSTVENNSQIEVQCGERISIKTNSLTVRLFKVSDVKPLVSSESSSSPIANKRRSSFCDNCSQGMNSPDVRQKRVRKPKSHLYPGEEDDSPVAKTSNPNTKTSCKPKPLPSCRKSLLGKVDNSPVSKTKSTKPKRLSTDRKSLSRNSRPKINITKRKSSTTPSKSKIENKSSGSSSKTAKNKTKKADEDSTGKKQVSKKSSMKKSLYTPRTTSSTDGSKQSIESGDAARPRRNKTSVCYKESPMNVKLRRP